MARKRSSRGSPAGRTDEEHWTPPGSSQPLQRTLDLALGNSSDDDPDFIYGDIVHDTESENPIAFVVVNVPGVCAEDWITVDGSLADQNPKYPDDDDVIVVTPLGVLNGLLPDWDEREVAIPLSDLVEGEIPIAPFPSLRLTRVKDSHLR